LILSTTRTSLPYGGYYVSGEPSPDLIASYGPGDVREMLTLDTLYRNKSNVTIRKSWVKKYLDSSVAATTKSSSDWPINFPLLRSEDVMLGRADRHYPAYAGQHAGGLRKERRHEFAWEGIYWYDLVRTNQYLPVMNPWLQTYYQKTIDQTQYIYPIPQPEMNIKPGLYHPNPGY
jgi:hypothetical protein